MSRTITFNGEERTIAVTISLKTLKVAPLCVNCYDYVEDPESRIVERARG